MRTENSTAVKVERAAFSLSMADTPFDKKPAYEVLLANNGRRALIYDTTEHTVSPNRQEWGPVVPAWHVVVVTKSGAFLAAGRYDDSGKTFTNPLELMLYIQRLSQLYSKVKTTTVATEDIGE